MTTNHSRRILGSTIGHPGTCNDTKIVLFDPLISNAKDGIIPDNFEFMLFERNVEGNIVEVPYMSVWFIVDNGYLAWSCTVTPIKDGTTYEEIRFSEWL